MEKKYTKKHLENKINEIKSYICSQYCKELSDYKYCYEQIAKYQELLKNFE